MSSLCSDPESLEHSVSPPRLAIAPPFRPGSSIPIGGHSSTEDQPHLGTGNEYTNGSRSRVTIEVLPEVALLDIFEFYMSGNQIEAWHTLVHVCRIWRILVFGSPRRLDLRLYCTARAPVRELLDVWPPLPIVVREEDYGMRGMDSIFAALEHNDRICQLDLTKISSPEMEKILPSLQQPFPAMTSLSLQLAPVIPDSFLGGSAPRLQTLELYRTSFPGLPKLLLSATQLVYLNLSDIPHSAYFSPAAMVTGLSGLTRLERLEMVFEYPQSRLDQRSRDPSLLTHASLPALTRLRFQGLGEYLEDLVARIDAPLLNTLTVTFHQLIFNTPQLTQFINRTPNFKAHDQARVVFHPEPGVWVTLPQRSGGKLHLEIVCSTSDQLLSLTQLCGLSYPPAFISAVEHLYIVEGTLLASHFEGDIENSPAQWLELLHFFPAVKCLYISRIFAPYIALSLREFVGERVTEVLPALQTLFLEEIPLGPAQEALGQFLATRRLVGHPIAISYWNGIRDVLDETEN